MKNLSVTIRERLRCPICGGRLGPQGEELVCTNDPCGVAFPVVDGVPVLLNEKRSLFLIADVIAGARSDQERAGSAAGRALRRLAPAMGRNVRAGANYRRLVTLLFDRAVKPRVLVIGGGVLGQGMEFLSSAPGIELVETDVMLGPRTMLVCDAHDVPFEDRVFDGVVAQAVLEHVADPYRCVEEVHRLLNPGGLVYAEVPFMQQVHMGRHDFTRFTYLGLRRLFRGFKEIESGATCGPGMALAWAYEYFLASFFSSRRLRSVVRAFARVTSFYLKYCDYYLVRKAGALDAASSIFFLGERAGSVMSDRELIRQYRGLS
ncbi:MAG: methyltransferase domain-containing protein [Thermoanaerobaculales bacterium]